MTAQNLITLPLLALSAYAQEPSSKLRASGPQTLAIAYRCNPDQRANFRQIMTNEVARFEGWKKQGILKDYQILFNNYLDSETYDLLT